MKYLAAAALALIASPAAAEVVSATANGFEVRESVILVAPPALVFSSLGNIGAWWNKEHTYSGNSANLSLSLRPGGCFCERFPDGGGVEHMRVVYVEPGKKVVMTGALGPLLYEGSNGVMQIDVEKKAGGTELVMSYRVAGFARGGGDKMAAQVDEVLTEQLKNFRQYVTRRPRT